MAGVDMKLIGEVFNSSLIPDEDIDLNHYLSAYGELYKLCSLLGTIFGFVGSEILSKIGILRELKNNEANKIHFNSMKSMVSYEMDHDLLYKRNYVSGSRTLLRLHRGLAFLSMFLTRVNQLDLHDSTSAAGREAYDRTLAQYHTWFVRSGASVAMYSLPTKEVLLNRVCANNVSQCVQILPRMLEVMEVVYNRIQHYYSDNQLLGLP